MQFTVLLHSLLENPVDRAELRLEVSGTTLLFIERSAWDETKHVVTLPDQASLNVLGIRLEARFPPRWNLEGNLEHKEEVLTANAETSGARGISIVQSVPDSVTAHLLHTNQPAVHQCRVRCPQGEWIYGQPGGTCVDCKTASGKKLTLCC
jgi:hypothetical protein